MKIVSVIGARPQFIKAKMVSKVISSRKEFNEIMIHTGQHYDANMSNIFFKQMNISKPDYNLGINSLPHGAMLGRQIEKVEEILLKEKPDRVLVYGDTNSTLAGALASSKLNIVTAHIESGLRSYNKKMPEEINRILTDHCSDILFTPTANAQRNLIKEGIKKEKIINVGDVMFDAFKYYYDIADKKSKIIKDLGILKNEYILTTIHRQENTDSELNIRNIFKGLSQSPFNIILPLHPRTKNKLDNLKINIPKKIKMIDPVGYLDMSALIKNAYKIVTDSGGLQKESYFYQKDCITVRNQTEWIETIESGYNTLVGPNEKNITRAINSTKKSKKSKNFFGNGNASQLIVENL